MYEAAWKHSHDQRWQPILGLHWSGILTNASSTIQQGFLDQHTFRPYSHPGNCRVDMSVLIHPMLQDLLSGESEGFILKAMGLPIKKQKKKKPPEAFSAAKWIPLSGCQSRHMEMNLIFMCLADQHCSVWKLPWCEWGLSVNVFPAYVLSSSIL